MSWETPGGRRYYFTAKKVNGRVVKRYVGAGELAGAMAGLEALDRERRQEQRAAVKAERDRLDALDQSVADFSGAVDAAVTKVLTAAGYHRHDRGAWRKRRQKGSSTTA
jgi:hypothetical protein